MIPKASKAESVFMLFLAFAVIVTVTIFAAVPRANGIAATIPSPIFGPQLPLLY